MTERWTYTLTGFGEFLEMRRVSFSEPMPAARLCGVCGLLPCRTVRLPCGHVFCESCKAQIGRGDSCPFGGKKFADSEVHSMSVERSDLEQSRIVCTAGPQVCGFAGKLCELGDHLTKCGGGETRCGKCQRSVFRGLAVDHYRKCTGTPVAANAEIVAKGLEDVAKTDVETPRELMLGKGVDLEAMYSSLINALAERVASLERRVLELVNKYSSDPEP
nr:TNF receptor-associated factor 6-like [Dermacentor andersoni]